MENPIQNGSNAVRKGAGKEMKRRRGFTFVELMVVITIIVILISMAIPIYNRSIIRAKESVLANGDRPILLRQGKGSAAATGPGERGVPAKAAGGPHHREQPDMAYRDGRSQPECVAIRARHLRREERFRQNGVGWSCIFREVTTRALLLT